MPFVNIRTVKGLLNEEQKLELHQRITELMIEIEGGGDPDFKQYIMILIEEQDAEDWSVSGVSLTAEAVRKIKGKLS
ncbi:MAG: 4-oxalocrotonate tautomerase family protein [Xenococcaceae cyanobacterium MO_207.B15]|nr:4-oxalocrotonate tautomerase family protein [Xenococcaceae cyanobacterium MO_207.B15]